MNIYVTAFVVGQCAIFRLHSVPNYRYETMWHFTLPPVGCLYPPVVSGNDQQFVERARSTVCSTVIDEAALNDDASDGATAKLELALVKAKRAPRKRKAGGAEGDEGTAKKRSRAKKTKAAEPVIRPPSPASSSSSMLSFVTVTSSVSDAPTSPVAGPSTGGHAEDGAKPKTKRRRRVPMAKKTNENIGRFFHQIVLDKAAVADDVSSE